MRKLIALGLAVCLSFALTAATSALQSRPAAAAPAYQAQGTPQPGHPTPPAQSQGQGPPTAAPVPTTAPVPTSAPPPTSVPAPRPHPTQAARPQPTHAAAPQPTHAAPPQTHGQGQKPAGQPTGNNAACVGKKEQCPVPGSQTALNPASGACVYNHGQYVSQQHKQGNGPPNKNRTCTPAGGTTPPMTGSTGTTVTSSTATFAPTYRASVVPVGAVEVSRVAAGVNGTGTTVTYQVGATYYHVTYQPNGTYTYMTNGSPSVLGSYTTASTGVGGPSVAGSTTGAPGVLGSTGYGTGVTAGLPRSGGGSGTPSSPFIPLLLGLVLAGAGVLTRAFVTVNR